MPAATSLQPRKPKGKRTGGQFSHKPAPDKPPLGYRLLPTDDTPQSSAAAARAAISKVILTEQSRLSHPSANTEVLADSWSELNAMASAARQARDDAAAAWLSEGMDPGGSAAESGLKLHLGRWSAKWVKGVLPEDCAHAREWFVEQASENEWDCEDVEAMSRRMWPDSAWSTAGLRDAGVDPGDVAQHTPNDDKRIIPDVDCMHDAREEHLPTFCEAFAYGNHAERFLAAAECCQELSELRDQAAAQICAVADFGKLRNGAGVPVGRITDSGHYHTWRIEDVERHLREASGGDPTRLAAITAVARSNSFRGGSGIDAVPVKSTDCQRPGVDIAPRSQADPADWRAI